MAKNHSDRKDEVSGRYHLMFWMMVFFFVILGARLWYLQVIKGEELQSKIELNYTRTGEVVPVRGLILDRNGTVLVDNRASFDLYLQKSKVINPEKTIKEISSITGADYDDLMKSYKDDKNPLVKDLTWEQLVKVESRRYCLEGVGIEVKNNRHPLVDVLAPHTLGYLREISKERLESERKRQEDAVRRLVSEGETREDAQKKVRLEQKPHRAGDLVGASGIEQSMEYYLHGRRGVVEREVNALEKVIKETIKENPESGHNIRLTLDSRLQAIAQSLLGERAGAIVVMDPRNFEVLALASSPTFRLSDFSGGISSKQWKNLLDDPFAPLFHRAVAGEYPPGSTYKIAVALAALAEGIITPSTVFHCNGSMKIANDTFHCHNRFGHGPVDLKKSLVVSCDVYYYEIGRLMGIDLMSRKIGEFFGFGHKTGIELSSEMPGQLPNTEWKLRVKKERWNLGDTVTASMGQSFILTTPLQVTQMTAVVANGGTLYRPHLVKEVADVEGRIIKSFEPEIVSKVDIDPAYFAVLQRSLEAVVNDPGGTGRRAALPDVAVAGKTGTAQIAPNSITRSYDRNSIPYKYRDHAWFTGYAPAENPEVVVTVFLERTGGGGTFAAPIGGRMIAAYFDPSIMASTLPPPQVQPDKPTSWRAAIGE